MSPHRWFAPPEDDFVRQADVEYLRVDAPKGKKIAVAVRVEPKVIFATERTFLVGIYLLTDYMN